MQRAKQLAAVQRSAGRIQCSLPPSCCEGAGSWCAAGRVAPCSSCSPHLLLTDAHIAALPALLVRRSGQLVRGWEGGILRFLAARFAEKHGFWGSIREAVQVCLCGRV